MPFIDNFICFCGDGMIESMLEPHMKVTAGSSQLDVGVAFIILGAVYMSCSIIAGFVSWHLVAQTGPNCVSTSKYQCRSFIKHWSQSYNSCIYNDSTGIGGSYLAIRGFIKFRRHHFHFKNALKYLCCKFLQWLH
jgi:hypothetical protein